MSGHTPWREIHRSKPFPCSGCGASIRIFTMTSGKRMPVLAEPFPYPEGTVVVDEKTGKGKVLTNDDRAAVFLGIKPTPTETWKPHWADCPKADDFRGPR